MMDVTDELTEKNAATRTEVFWPALPRCATRSATASTLLSHACLRTHVAGRAPLAGGRPRDYCV